MTDRLSHQICFKAPHFSIHAVEDQKTNPGRYGQALAQWLREKLLSIGYKSIEQVVPEDWGWCVMFQRHPFRLFVACGNMDEADDVGSRNAAHADKEIIWSCFVAAELPLIARLFRRQDATGAVERLHADLTRLLASEPAVVLVECP